MFAPGIPAHHPLPSPDADTKRKQYQRRNEPGEGESQDTLRMSSIGKTALDSESDTSNNVRRGLILDSDVEVVEEPTLMQHDNQLGHYNENGETLQPSPPEEATPNGTLPPPNSEASSPPASEAALPMSVAPAAEAAVPKSVAPPTATASEAVVSKSVPPAVPKSAAPVSASEVVPKSISTAPATAAALSNVPPKSAPEPITQTLAVPKQHQSPAQAAQPDTDTDAKTIYKDGTYWKPLGC